MQQEIDFQKTQNSQLKEELADKENEKTELGVELKESEENLKKIKQESDDLMKKLQNSEEDYIKLEAGYRDLCSKLKSVEDEIENLIEKERLGQLHINEISENAEKITNERNDLIYKLNDLAEKYEMYVKTLNQEREDITKTNYKHTKLLVGGILFETIKTRILIRQGYTLNKIKKYGEFIQKRQKKLIEVLKIRKNYVKFMKSNKLLKWKQKALKTIKQIGINLHLIDKKVNKKLLGKIFDKWHTKFIYHSDLIHTHLNNAKRIYEIRSNYLTKYTRKCFTKWIKFSKKLVRRDKLISLITLRKIKKLKFDSLLKWLFLIRTIQSKQNLDKLIFENTEQKFKRTIFDNFIFILRKEQDEKIANFQKVVDENLKENARTRFLRAATKILFKESQKNDQALKSEIYNSFKFNRLFELREKTKNELNVLLPENQAMAEKIQQNSLNHSIKLKYNILRRILAVHARRMRYFLERWQNNICFMDESAIALAKIIKRWQQNKVKSAFDDWYKKMHLLKTNENTVIITSALRQIDSLTEENKNLSQIVEKQNKTTKNLAENKLARIAKIISRKKCAHTIKRWVKYTRFIQNFENGLNKLSKTFNRHIKSESLNKWINQKNQIRKEISYKNKENIIRDLVSRNLLKNSFISFQQGIKNQQFAKNTLYRLLSSKLTQNLHRRFSIWRQKSHLSQNSHIFTENTELKNNIQNMQNQLKETSSQKQKILENITDHKNSLKNKSVLNIFKMLNVSKLTQLKNGFIKWKTWALHKQKPFRDIMKRYILKNYHNELRAVLQKWKRFNFVNHLDEIQNELKSEMRKYDTIARLSAIQLDEANESNRLLKDTIFKIKQQHGIDESRKEKAVNILFKMHKKYLRKSFEGNFFLGWRDMVVREKILQGQAKEITRMFVGKFIYAKLKQTAINNKFDEKLMTKLTKFNILLNRIYSKYYFSRWRTHNFTNENQIRQSGIDAQYTKLEEAYNKQENIKENTFIKYENEITNRRKLRVLRGFQKVTNNLKNMRLKTKLLQDVLRMKRVSWTFSKWHEDVSYLELCNLNEQKAIQKYNKTLLSKLIKLWLKISTEKRILPKSLDKISKRQYFNLKGYGFESLTKLAIIEQNKINEIKAKSINKIWLLLDKKLKTNLSNILGTLHRRSMWIKSNKELLKNMLIRLLNSKVSHALRQWRIKTGHLNLVDKIETHGETAKKAREMQRKHDSLMKIVTNEKMENSLEKSRARVFGDVSPIKPVPMNASMDFGKKVQINEMEEYKKKPEEMQSDLYEMSFAIKDQDKTRIEKNREKVSPFIKLWLQITKKQDTKAKYINLWKKWLQIRNKVEKTSEFILKRLLFAEKSWALDKLKNMKRSAKLLYSKVPRRQIISKIESQRKKLRDLEQDKENIDQNLAKREKINMVKAIACVRGKRMAANVLYKRLQQPLVSKFRNWKREALKNKINQLGIVLQDKLTAFQKLHDINGRLNMKNKSLMIECEELRQASMDGVEIANVIQAITQEREQLSVDLANKSMTIKKLVEENALLQNKLEQAQLEAQNLMKLTKGSAFSKTTPSSK